MKKLFAVALLAVTCSAQALNDPIWEYMGTTEGGIKFYVDTNNIKLWANDIRSTTIHSSRNATLTRTVVNCREDTQLVSERYWEPVLSGSMIAYIARRICNYIDISAADQDLAGKIVEKDLAAFFAGQPLPSDAISRKWASKVIAEALARSQYRGLPLPRPFSLW